VAELEIVYALAPQKGRIGKARQVPVVRVPAEPIETGEELSAEIEKAFFKYHRYGVVAGIVDLAGGLFGTTNLYCEHTGDQIATITITKEYAQ